MGRFVDPFAGWDREDLEVLLLDGEPPVGFDCGREEQNVFLYERAWKDQRRRLSATRLFFIKGMFAAYATTLADAVDLGTREKDSDVPFTAVPALKIAQLAVEKRFAGCGLGRLLVGYVFDYAGRIGREVGCRYVTVDARPELESWYASLGFVRNKLMQKRKLERAKEAGRDASAVTVSMRFDLLEL